MHSRARRRGSSHLGLPGVNDLEVDGASRSGSGVAPRKLSRKQALAWSDKWSYTDLKLIEQHLDRLRVSQYYIPRSGGYVGCISRAGEKVMFLHPGYVTFTPSLAPIDRPEQDWPGLLLSTFRGHATPIPAPGEGKLRCTVHNIALPLNGVCDECH